MGVLAVDDHTRDRKAYGRDDLLQSDGEVLGRTEWEAALILPIEVVRPEVWL